MKKITYELLVKHYACERQRDRFAELFPNGMAITIENMSQLAAATYVTAWDVGNLTPDWLYGALLDYRACTLLRGSWLLTAGGIVAESTDRRPDQCAAYGHDLAQITAALQAAPEPK